MSTERKDDGGPATVRKMQRVCRDIASDMAADAREFDGKPFNGRTVAEYFGNQGAAIAALARVVDDLLDELAERQKERG